MAASLDLNVARKNLCEALGENMKLYLQILKSWFRQKITKEDFDGEARNLLESDTVHLHNEFLLAIIGKCQSLSSSLVPRDLTNFGQHSSKLQRKIRPRKKSHSGRPQSQRFVPVNPLSYAPVVSPRSLEDDSSVGTAFAARELSLPDISMVHGRMIVCAWENGLEEVQDQAVKLIMVAVELKNVLSSLLSRRNGYKIRENRFKYAVGAPVSNPYLRQTHQTIDISSSSGATSLSSSGMQMPSLKPSYDLGDRMASQQLMTTTSEPIQKGQITLFDLLETLQNHKDVIPSHSVYAPTVEKIIHKIWHPSNDEQSQELIHQQEQLLKKQISSNQFPNR